MLLQSFFLLYELLTFAVELLSLALSVGNVLISKADSGHVLLNHVADAISLLGVVLLQPSANDIE